jgi:hypothetical protein
MVVCISKPANNRLEIFMVRKFIAPILLATLMLAGCAVMGRGHPRPTPLHVSGPYDAFYDSYYGLFTDGYWGRDGGFWYVNEDHNWRRDHGGHFRHDDAGGDFKLVHGKGSPRVH